MIRHFFTFEKTQFSLTVNKCEEISLIHFINFLLWSISLMSDKGVIIDMNSFSVKQGSISVLATSASPFAKPLPEGMSLLASTIKPGNLSA